MKNNHFIIKLLILFPLIFLAACDPVTLANGVVHDESGNSLQDVVVVLESNANGLGDTFRKESVQKTGMDGKFNFVTIMADATRGRLIFKKEGFETQVKDITPNSENHLDIVLTR